MKLHNIITKSLRVLISCETKSHAEAADRYCKLASKSIKSSMDKTHYACCILPKLTELQYKFNLQ